MDSQQKIFRFTLISLPFPPFHLVAAATIIRFPSSVIHQKLFDYLMS